MEGIVGTVKSFGLSKGYGFIASDVMEGDIFFAKTALPQDLVDAVDHRCFDLAGRQVSFTMEAKSGKAQVNSQFKARDIQLVPCEGQPLVGKIKQYSPTEGYGFIGAQALLDQDIFFVKTELPAQLQHSASLPGTPLSFCCVQTQEGQIQAQSLRLGKGTMEQEIDLSALAAMDPHTLGLAFMNGTLPFALPTAAPPATKLPRLGDTMSGMVKAFNQEKGYGFIQAQDRAGKDIYFKAQGIQQGMCVDFTVTVMQDGKVQARDVRAHGTTDFEPEAKRQKAAVCPAPPDFYPPATLSGLSEGTVKSYGPDKGWGFINCAGVDIYFKGSSLPPGHAQRTDLIGANVAFEINRTRDGKLQTQPGILLTDGL